MIKLKMIEDKKKNDKVEVCMNGYTPRFTPFRERSLVLARSRIAKRKSFLLFQPSRIAKKKSFLLFRPSRIAKKKRFLLFWPFQIANLFAKIFRALRAHCICCNAIRAKFIWKGKLAHRPRVV